MEIRLFKDDIAFGIIQDSEFENIYKALKKNSEVINIGRIMIKSSTKDWKEGFSLKVIENDVIAEKRFAFPLHYREISTKTVAVLENAILILKKID